MSAHGRGWKQQTFVAVVVPITDVSQTTARNTGVGVLLEERN